MQKTTYIQLGVFLLLLSFAGCKIPQYSQREPKRQPPQQFRNDTGGSSAAEIDWHTFFKDPQLCALIDSALANNQELSITQQDIYIAQAEARARKGEYQPMVDLGAAAGAEKVGRYTSQGANDANTEIEPGKEFPEILPDFMLGAFASWELDIWRKLRNARKSALLRYQATTEARNFLTTRIVAEIAMEYYELMAMDNRLRIIQNNLEIQAKVLEIIRLEKQSARVTELAVRRFEAEVYKNQSYQYELQQEIIEVENRINFLLGRYPQAIPRNSETFPTLVPDTVFSGMPADLLSQRPDIRQAELELEASKLDVKVAKANFYPSLRLTAGLGFQAFNPVHLIRAPESLLASLAGDLAGPLLNRKAIKADYATANAKQVQAVLGYEQTLLQAYLEVSNQLSSIQNLQKSYALQAKRVEALNKSISISTILFRSAKADYMEVLLTQREALDARMELIDTKLEQMHSIVSLYQALGGGWR